MMLKWKLIGNRVLAITWLFMMSLLFMLPGSALPEQDWLIDVQIDKWAHIGVFAILVVLWKSSFRWAFDPHGIILFIFCLGYGIIVEIAQKYLVANRSFDFWDLLADAMGTLLGLIVWGRVYKKNKPL